MAVSPAPPSISVWPSGAACAVAWAAIMPLAPVRFSTTTGWPSAARSGSARKRALMSCPPPAA